MDYSTRATEAMQKVIENEMTNLKRRAAMSNTFGSSYGTSISAVAASLAAARAWGMKPESVKKAWEEKLKEFALMGSVMITPEDVKELTDGLKEAAGTSVFTDLAKLRKALDEAPVPIHGRSLEGEFYVDLDTLFESQDDEQEQEVDELVGSQGAPRRERKGKRKDWERSASVKQAHSGKKQVSIAKRQRLREDLAAKGIHYRER